MSDSKVVNGVPKSVYTFTFWMEHGIADKEVQGHHVRKLKDIKKQYQGRKRKHPPKWIEIMIKRNRKVVFVCLDCHTEIHNGKYDGRKVESRLTGEPYDTETVTYGSEGASWKSASINIAA